MPSLPSCHASKVQLEAAHYHQTVSLLYYHFLPIRANMSSFLLSIKEKNHHCTFGDCTKSFSDPSSLLRHEKTRHNFYRKQFRQAQEEIKAAAAFAFGPNAFELGPFDSLWSIGDTSVGGFSLETPSSMSTSTPSESITPTLSPFVHTAMPGDELLYPAFEQGQDVDIDALFANMPLATSAPAPALHASAPAFSPGFFDSISGMEDISGIIYSDTPSLASTVSTPSPPMAPTTPLPSVTVPTTTSTAEPLSYSPTYPTFGCDINIDFNELYASLVAPKAPSPYEMARQGPEVEASSAEHELPSLDSIDFSLDPALKAFF